MKTTGYNAQWLTEALAPSDHPLKENMKPVRRHSLIDTVFDNAGLSTRFTRSTLIFRST
ncbi:hypothetical protein [Methylobacter sp.]|uniref:hypothetical protein n=1 Tax=Methylobacter sp. TaxID=2051955 RepID=UPI003FA574B8